MIERAQLFPHPRYPIADVIQEEIGRNLKTLNYSESLAIAEKIIDRLAEEYGVTRTYNERFTLLPTPEKKETRI